MPVSIELLESSSCGHPSRTLFSRLESELSTWLNDTIHAVCFQADFYNPGPFALLAVLTALCAAVLRISPETLGKPLPDSMIEADRIGREDRMPKLMV